MKLCMLSAYYAFFKKMLPMGSRSGEIVPVKDKIFIWQKKVVRILINVNDKESRLPIFKEFHIMPSPISH